MNMRKLASGLRPLGLGLICAIIGFSYALATTSSRGTDGKDLGNRAISTNATRPDTIFVTEADLGFVVVGSLFTRQVNVVFGFKPHLFQFTGTPPAGITISDSGTIQGKAEDAGTYGFDVRVFDREVRPSSKQTTKSYSITAVPALRFPSPLEIVNTSPLPTGVTNAPYSYTFHANGGILPYEYFLVEDDFALVPKGLKFGIDGLLFGKPVLPTNGTTFRVGVIDGGGTVVIKAFTIRILTGTVTSEFVGMRGTLNLEFGKDGVRDTGTLSLYVNKTDLYNANIRKTADLENVFFVMNIGGAQVPPSKFLLYGPDGTLASGATDTSTSSDELYLFDKSGSITFPNPRRGILKKQGETTTYAIKLNPQTGLLTVKFKDLEFIKALGANFLSFNVDPILPVNIQFGTPAKGRVKIINKDDEEDTTQDPTDPTAPTDPVGEEADPVGTKNKDINIDRTDNIRFAFRRSVKRNKGNASENTKRPPGGLFLTTKVAGDIRKEEIFKRKDSLFMQFSGLLSDVDGAPIPITADDKIQVFASEVNLAEFPASMLVREGTNIVFRNADPAIGLKTLILDTVKGTFFLETNAMDPRRIFGVDFVESGEPLTLPLTITIFNPLSVEPKFDGQTQITVFRRGNKLRNR